MNLTLYTDRVQAGDLTVANQTFGYVHQATNSTDASLTQFPQDGIFGLSRNDWTFTDDLKLTNSSFYKNMLTNLTTEYPGWSLALPLNGPGSLILGKGEMDQAPSLYASAQVNSTDMLWSVPGDLRVNGSKVSAIDRAYIATSNEQVSFSNL